MDELLLTQEEILRIRGNDNSFEPADIKRIKRLNKYLKAQLAKAKPLIEKEERERILEKIDNKFWLINKMSGGTVNIFKGWENELDL